MPLEDGDQPGGDPQRQDQPRQAVDPREGRPERAGAGSRHTATGRPANCRGRASTGPQRQDRAQDEEDQEIRQRDQPDEMPAHPVELIEIDVRLRTTIVPTSSSPETRPHQIDRTRT